MAKSSCHATTNAFSHTADISKSDTNNYFDKPPRVEKGLANWSWLFEISVDYGLEMSVESENLICSLILFVDELLTSLHSFSHSALTDGADHFLCQFIRMTDSKPEVCFLGAGLMGAPMIKRLLSSFRVAAYNRSRDKLEKLKSDAKELGSNLIIASTAAEAVSKSTTICVMLSEVSAIRSVLFPSQSPAPALSGKTVINFSTIGPKDTVALAAEVAKAGAVYVESPVLGSVPVAEKGQLNILVGGPTADVLEKHRALFEVLGRPRYIGPSPAPSHIKLALNQVILAQVRSVFVSVFVFVFFMFLGLCSFVCVLCCVV